MAKAYQSDDDEDYSDAYDEFADQEIIQFPLYEHMNPEASVNQGALKSFDIKAGGSVIYADKKSDYTVTVDRLLWTDGYEETKKDADPSEYRKECTLVVLKIKIVSGDPRTKVEHFNATLQLKDKDENGANEPQILAWAPFRNLERWNETEAHKERTNAGEVGAQVGYTGTELSITHNRERRVSWSQTDFDQGYSSEEISTITQRRNGVSWYVQQNRLQNQGAIPELWISALFSRSSRKPYVVDFSINTRAGRFQDIKQNVKKFFGTRPGQTNAYTVTPWKKTLCNYEGEEIRKSIDINNLGTLRSGTTLNVTWGPGPAMSPTPRTEVNTSAPRPLSVEHIVGDTVAGADEGSEQTSVKMHNNTGNPSTATLSATNQGESSYPRGLQPGSTITLPPLVIGWQHTNVGVDSDRLAALQQRLAQVEFRLAAQDEVIMRLREAQLNTDTQLAHLMNKSLAS